MREHLRAGIAVYDAGEFHAAHDAWEDHWLSVKEEVEDPPATVEEAAPDEEFDRLPSPAADERLLHGLIQFTAAVHHLAEESPAGATGLADSGVAYLAPLPGDYRGVNVGDVREFLARVADDPENAPDPPLLTHEDEVVTPVDLDLDELAVAAGVIAAEADLDESTVEEAVEFAREDGGTGPFRSLLIDLVGDAENRGIVYRRLSDHVARRRRRDEDVEGLF